MSKEKYSRLRQLIQFGIIVFVMAAVLAVLNWLPTIMQKQRLQRFASVDQARKELRIPKIYLPTYIPEDLNLAWPPAEVYGQDTPFMACMTHFTFRDKKETAMVIQQAETRASYQFEPMLRIREKKAPHTISIKSRKASLVSAVCDQDIPCNQLSWNEEGTRITLTAKIPARDIIRIAASMLPEI